MLLREEDRRRPDGVEPEEASGRHERQREEQNARIAAPVGRLTRGVAERDRDRADEPEDDEVELVVLDVGVELGAQEQREETDEGKCGRHDADREQGVRAGPAVGLAGSRGKGDRRRGHSVHYACKGGPSVFKSWKDTAVTERPIPVIVVGAGQAGLATSRELTKAGVEHVVLERGRIGQTWRGRWDSFCLVTPNWSVQLPDGHYDGPDPDGFMPRDEIVSYLERYAAGAPVRENVSVDSIEALDGGFVLRTSAGELRAGSVVLATGAYQRPHRPAAADTLPVDLFQIDVDDYRNEEALPPGRVLVVGSAQSGCQIAEELHEAGRDVVVACGRAAWAPRRFGGRDLVWWLVETGQWRLGSNRCRAPKPGSSETSSPPVTAAVTTFTCARCRRRASSSPATSSARRTAGCSSHRISPRPSPRATSGTCSS